MDRVGESAKQGDVASSGAARNALVERCLVLDGLRGIAAAGIILDHVPSGMLGALTPGRYLAVDFFWVLSGFVLALGYDARLSTTMSVGEFVRLRMIRLYPLYFAALCLAAVVALLPILLPGFSHGMTGTQIAAIFLCGLLFVPFPPVVAATGQHLFPLNGSSWTLFFELLANVVYGLIARLLTIRNLVILVAISAVAFVIVGLQHPPGSGWRWPTFMAGLTRVLFCFFAGVLIYRLRPWLRLRAIPWPAAIVGYLAIIMTPVPDDWRVIFNIAIALTAMPLLVALTAETRVGPRMGRVFATLGMLSYGVYVLHVPIWLLIQFVEERLNVSVPGVVNVAMVAAIAVAIAWIANALYDVPLRRWLTRRARWPRPGQTPAPATGN